MFAFIEVTENNYEICDSGVADYFRVNSPNFFCGKHLGQLYKYADASLVTMVHRVSESIQAPTYP